MQAAINERNSLNELLTRNAENTALYAALVGAEMISDIGQNTGFSFLPGYRLIRVDRRLDKDSANQFEIALVDDALTSVTYYVHATLLSIPEAGSRSIVRHKVWRSADMRHSLALRDISRTVLFGYMLQLYDLLLEEGAITGDGKFYWHRQVSRAIEMGYQVYAYNLKTHTLQSIPTQHALNSVHDQDWSCDAPNLFRALISVHPLDSR